MGIKINSIFSIAVWEKAKAMNLNDEKENKISQLKKVISAVARNYSFSMKGVVPYKLYLKANQFFYNEQAEICEKVEQNVETGLGRGLVISELLKMFHQKIDFIVENVNSNFNLLKPDARCLNKDICYSKEQTVQGMESLKSDFNIGLGKVLVLKEMQKAENKKARKHIFKIFEKRGNIIPAENFVDGLEYYKQSCTSNNPKLWEKEAKTALEKSIRAYKRNPIALLHLGHIHHYASEYIDFKKAYSYYKLCGMYGEAYECEHKISAQGYFYAGWIKATIFQKPKGAIALFEKALQFDPNLGEAHYLLAKLYAKCDNMSQMQKHLMKAITKFDRNYAIKALLDTDFLPFEEQLTYLLIQIRNYAKKSFNQKVSVLIKRAMSFSSIYQELAILRKQANERNTIFEYMDACRFLIEKTAEVDSRAEILSQNQKAKKAYLGAIKISKRYIEESVNEIQRETTFEINQYNSLDKFQKQALIHQSVFCIRDAINNIKINIQKQKRLVSCDNDSTSFEQQSNALCNYVVKHVSYIKSMNEKLLKIPENNVQHIEKPSTKKVRPLPQKSNNKEKTKTLRSLRNRFFNSEKKEPENYVQRVNQFARIAQAAMIA